MISGESTFCIVVGRTVTADYLCKKHERKGA